MMNKLSAKYSIWFILGLTLISLFPLRHACLDLDPSRFFPSNDPDVSFYRDFREKFQTSIDEEFIFIGLGNHEGIFRKAFLQKTDSLAQWLSQQAHIRKVYSITNTSIIYFRNNEVNFRPLIRFLSPEKYADDSVYLFQSKEYRDLLVSRDGRSLALAAFNEEGLTPSQKAMLVQSIQSKMDSLRFDEVHFTSRIGAEKVLADELKRNFLLLSLGTVLIIGLSLFIHFRSFKTTLLVLSTVGIASVWTLAIASLLNFSVGVFTLFLPLVLLVYLLPAAIWSRFPNQVRRINKRSRIQPSVYQPLLYSSVLLGIVFFSFGLSDIPAIRRFGILAGIAVPIGGILLFFLFPFLEEGITSVANGRVNKGAKISPIYDLLLRFKWAGLIAVLMIIGGSLFFAGKLETNSRFSQQIPHGTSLRDNFLFTENNFSGTRPFELSLTITDTRHSFFEVPVMQKVEELEIFLQKNSGMGNLISPLSLFKGANKAFHEGSNSFFRLPEQRDVPRLYEAIMQTEHAEEMQHYTSEDGTTIRISGLLHDLSFREFQQLRNSFDSFFRKKGFENLFSYRMTGPAYVYEKGLANLDRQLWCSLMIGFALLFSILFFSSGRFLNALLLTVCCVVALMAEAAVMSAAGFYFKHDSLLLFGISFAFVAGVSVWLAKGLVYDMGASLRKLIFISLTVIMLALLLTFSNYEMVSQFGLVFIAGLIIFSLAIILLAPLFHSSISDQPELNHTSK